MNTHGVVSPPDHGGEVVALQRTLNGDNVFKTDFLDGPVDGIFGEVTGRACIRAKFWVGYTEALQQPTYGKALHSLLTGGRKLSESQQARRVARLKHKDDLDKGKETSIGAKSVDYLKRFVGDTEDPPGSNISFATQWYRMNRQPWCAMALTMGAVEGGHSTAFKRGVNYAYCPYIVIAARHGGKGIFVVRYENIRKGDFFCVDWGHGSGVNPYTFDHTGYIRNSDRRGTFWTREGNTSFDSSGSQSNGGAMADRTRTIHDGTFVFMRIAK